MTLRIDNDIILPVVTALLAVALTVAHTSLMLTSTHEAIIEELVTHEQEAFQDASSANKEVDRLTKELETYRVTIADIEHAGASHTQAVDALKASQLYNLDPKL